MSTWRATPSAAPAEDCAVDFQIDVDQISSNRSSRGLQVLAESLRDAFSEIGLRAELLGRDPPDPGAHLVVLGLTDGSRRLPESAIIYNAEQIGASPFLKDVRAYRGNVIWDFAGANIPRLRERGAVRVVHCPFGYTPGLERVPLARHDIDVLFYGRLNARRQAAIDALRRARVAVTVAPQGTYGPDLDKFIARAKVVLNVHYYPGASHEIFRTGYLFANRKCVVSEGDGGDPDLEDLARRCAQVVPFGGIAAECARLVEDAEARAAVGLRGYVAFQQVSFAAAVRSALVESGFTLEGP